MVVDQHAARPDAAAEEREHLRTQLDELAGTDASPGARLRDLLHGAEIARVAGAHDALSAVLADQAGYDAVWASSLTISATRGLPDVSLLTMTEYLQTATEMAQMSRVPVLADCDSGFGGRLNVAYAVRLYEAANVGGICIEDKTFPKANSFMDTTQELIPADDFARKIESGKRAQRDTDFVVIARTEALISGYDVDEALTRAEIYTDAGADGVLVHSKQDSPREVLEFLHRWSRRSPVVVVPTTYYNWPAREAAAAGVSMVIYANHTLRAAISAMRAALSEIESSGCTSTLEPNISSVDELFDLVRLDEWLSLEQ